MHGDPYLHAWIVTRYDDVITVLTRFSAERAPSPEYFQALGAADVAPIAKMMVKQMLFRDGPARVRKLAGGAFMPPRVRVLRDHIQEIANQLIANIKARGDGRVDMLADFAEPLPAIVTSELLGVPAEDHVQLSVPARAAWRFPNERLLGDQLPRHYQRALRRKSLPAAGVVAWPAGAALWLKDTVTVRSLPAVSKSVAVDFADDFDARFDAFWHELARQNVDQLLAVRDRASLQWHFAFLQRLGRLWIITAVRDRMLRAYAIFKRQGPENGVRRMQLIDYQTLDTDEDLLPGLLQLALRRCASENLFALEQIGCGVPKRPSFDKYAPHRHQLSCWRYYFRAADPALHAELQRPEVWDPSTFDGDASFD